MHDFFRIACAVPSVHIGDPRQNLGEALRKLREADARGVSLLAFPELCLTGYTCADLFFQDALLAGALDALKALVDESASLSLSFAVGLPLRIRGQLYNCAAVVSGGRLRGLAVKTFIPNYNEFYEKRWFESSENLPVGEVRAADIGLPGDYAIPVGRDLVFDTGLGVRFGVELCEDLWTPLPPSTFLTLAGAEVMLNLSASNEVIAKRAYRRELVRQQSARCTCVYAYASAGTTESTADLVFSGHSLVAENGALLAETPDELTDDALLVADADIGRVRADRMKLKSYGDAVRVYGLSQPCRFVPAPVAASRSDGALYPLQKLPFVPASKAHRLERCNTIFAMQVAGLKQRLRVTGLKPVIGISGGLDSTLALLVCVRAMRELGRPMTDVVALTLPCFGTSDRTRQNALTLMERLGVTAVEISVAEACRQHFRDIGHDPALRDGTYENSQARERTQVLMDYASRVGGLVVGTGDLSELALGWCTYNGDHMSMYGVNASIPKTLVRWMIDSVKEAPEFSGCDAVLADILDTPISPELLPPDEHGQIAQETESLVGPYALHDFFLYYVVRYGFAPRKIFALACRAFADDFAPDFILQWLRSFYKRFFSQQFKRDCLPDGVKVGSISLSPRGDWRMPSDATAALWTRELEEL